MVAILKTYYSILFLNNLSGQADILFGTSDYRYIYILKVHDATFSGVPMTASFLRERIHRENLYENHLSRFFWSL